MFEFGNQFESGKRFESGSLFEQRSPLILGQDPPIGLLGIFLRPRFAKIVCQDAASDSFFQPVTADAFWLNILPRQFIIAADQTPLADMKLFCRRCPIIKNDLPKNLASFVVEKVIEFHQIDLTDLRFSGIGTATHPQ